MARAGKTSRHLHGDNIKRINRSFKPEHLEAGYHQKEWGEHATPDHPLIGKHGNVTVEYVEDVPEGAGGPEFKITLPNEAVVTVLGSDVVEAYLELYA
jgi:hypothetical protein